MLPLRMLFGTCVVLGCLCCPESRALHLQEEQLPQAASQQSGFFPLSPSQLPEGPIIVYYQNGQLSIEAQNATLYSVLRAACNQTGTTVEIPSDADERLLGVFGPGTVREVFASLLNGSRFNYVMVGSNDNASRIIRLTLFLKPGPLSRPSPSPAPRVVAKAVEAPPIPPSPPEVTQRFGEPKPDQHSPQFVRKRHKRR